MNNLKNIRKNRGLSIRSLAKEANLSHTQIADIEKGASYFSQNSLQKLATALDVSISDLLVSKPETISNVNTFNPDKELIILPLYQHKLSAGNGILELTNINQHDYILMPILKSHLEKLTLANSSNLHLLPIDGDSMEPTLLNDSLAVIDITITDLNTQGGIYAFVYKQQSYIKRIQVTPDKLIMKSDNSNYETWSIALPLQEDCDFKIIGKVKANFCFEKI